MAEADPRPIDHDAATGDLPPTPATEPAAPIPRRVGDYHIKRVIASGGMGVVYEAVQQRPRRTVALKVMKQGLASRSALRRFEYESQILGRLRHPGIAEIYEAGMHDDGTGGVPYFAMEYVAGAKDVVRYVREKGLGVREKLELFARVCDAVHHGHQKGIIHRDLKPANILVDSLGQPKIIDFGVARATDSDLAVTTLQTDLGQLVGTVQYMSPEQIDADPHDLDIRSDVYALGVVLYELLTGRPPYDVAGTVIYEATRLIREERPRRLSSVDHNLRGDVETIVMHALEKDRDRRYQSAPELAQDIRRYLSNRTILARPPSVVYQLRTFVRRNKALVGGATALFLALVLGIVGTSVGLVRARTEAATYTAVSSFFEQAFASLEARDGPGPKAQVRELLDEAAQNVESELAGQPEVQARLRWSIGNGYKALTLYGEAENQLRTALATQRLVLGDRHPDTAQTLEDLASTLYFQGDAAAAEKLFRECLDTRLKLYPQEHEDVARTIDYLAASLVRQQQHEEAEALYRKALRLRRQLFGERHEKVAQSTNNLAMCLWSQGRLRDAEPLLREAIDIMRSLRGSDHVDVASGLTNLARLLVARGEPEAAEPLYRDALAIKRRVLGDDHARVAITLHHLAALLRRGGDELEEAERLCREALGIRSERFGAGHPDVISSAALLAQIQADRGAWAEAEASYRRLTAQRRLAYDDGDWRIAAADSALGEAIARQGRFEEAEPLLLKGLDGLEAAKGPAHAQTRLALDRVIELYERWERDDAAQPYLEKRRRLTAEEKVESRK